MTRDTWKDYLSFSKKERIAVFILSGLIITFFILPDLMHVTTQFPVIDTSLQKQLNAITIKPGNKSDNNAGYQASAQEVSIPEKPARLFNFDPNTLNADGFMDLGLSPKLANTIINYRNKGGRFFKPSDIKKIYGLSAGQAETLIPYIHIAQSESFTNSYTKNEHSYPDEKKFPKKEYHIININSATEEEWKTLPGIGDVLSKRIVKFRNSMHGFKSVTDVGRTFGLNDSTFQQIMPYLKLDDEVK